MATIRKRNNLWQVQVRRRTAPHSSKSFQRKSDAIAWARQMEIEADRGWLKHDPRVLERLTLSQLLERYRDTISIKKKGHFVEKYVVGALLRHPLAKRSVASLAPEDFAKFRDERLKEISGSGVNRVLALLQHVFDVAGREWGYPISANPVTLVRKPPENPARERRLSTDEYQRLMEATRKCRNRYVLPIIVTALETAMRRGEILGLRKRHIDLEKRTIRLPVTKNGRPRTIPLSEKALRILGTLGDDVSDRDDRIFPITPNALRLSWEHLKARAKISDLHFHDLRHEAISRLFEQGLGIAHVAAISGHRDFRMLSRYTHVGLAFGN